jgi:hypothetical protein
MLSMAVVPHIQAPRSSNHRLIASGKITPYHAVPTRKLVTKQSCPCVEQFEIPAYAREGHR